ncbi:hypothetical protein GNI_125710 [Gregarina niphandrodes]|uniref:Uncharacterized protein n=1 Tax=Gregarina niphandrodes TaxID=110365 RepID=A0A023B238_GRENI|nr:hypothetical protein GNI_125710 [Gregarina niphandrodes]EZG50580.1 hypothetical protein GNI_125710 [Gregarina niphandrodes]|eukprot:XP_011132009.1 hypothetical protein GNI_125710 [Gregarina niphandrodes]
MVESAVHTLRVVRDFPLKWSGSKNGCVLASILRNEQVKRVSQIPDPISLVCEYWFFRYSSAVCVLHDVTDLLSLFRDEAQQNCALMRHNAYAGCIPLSDLGRQSMVEFVSDLKKKEALERPSQQILNAYPEDQLTQWNVTSLPLDKVSFMLSYLNQRMDLNDKNLQDIWKLIHYLKMEADFNDDELAIVGMLARKMEDFENLLMDMYHSTAHKTMQIKEAIDLGTHQDEIPFDGDQPTHSATAPPPPLGCSSLGDTHQGGTYQGGTYHGGTYQGGTYQGGTYQGGDGLYPGGTGLLPGASLGGLEESYACPVRGGVGPPSKLHYEPINEAIRHLPSIKNEEDEGRIIAQHRRTIPAAATFLLDNQWG